MLMGQSGRNYCGIVCAVIAWYFGAPDVMRMRDGESRFCSSTITEQARRQPAHDGGGRSARQKQMVSVYRAVVQGFA